MISRFFGIALAVLSLASRPSYALDEKFELYNAPQALGMGNAFTAEASGYAALFYNPAGLARGETRRPEVTLIGIDFIPGLNGLGSVMGAKSLGTYQLAKRLSQNTNRYDYFRVNVLPSFVWNGFGIALLGSYQFAGIYDGTVSDINATTDVGVVVGGALNFFGNRLKIGVSGKVIDRSQLKGAYDPAVFTSDADTAALGKEGLGIGGDIGLMFTLPQKYLPTFAAVWKDVGNTSFRSFRYLNKSAGGAPDPIAQSINVAFAIRPALGPRLRSVFTLEYKHLELPDVPWRKKIHFGVQLLTEKAFYIWLGANQLLPTFGIALRLPGGNLELGSYAEDVGYGQQNVADRRIFLRYTIGF